MKLLKAIGYGVGGVTLALFAIMASGVVGAYKEIDSIARDVKRRQRARKIRNH